LHLVDISTDCDDDTFLVKVNPIGPVCHTGTDTCWGEENKDKVQSSKAKVETFEFLSHLEDVIQDRKENLNEKSYVASLFKKGINKIAQKVGEEGVEVVIEAMDNNDDLFLNESADLLFHQLILLQAKGYKLKDVVEVLKGREK
jgi:phosphoribosyl-ATP pyrophosphohydrolase/phosphoribosyl-AMP cyclohydrolase